MNRRDFLLLRTEGGTKIVELSCERLYMQYVNAQMPTPPPHITDVEEGEPSARFETRAPRQLFDDLVKELADVDVLRVTKTEWLTVEDFRREVDRLTATICARGGRVEYR